MIWSVENKKCPLSWSQEGVYRFSFHVACRLLLVAIIMIKQTDRALAAQIVERGLLTQDIADKYLAEIKQLNTSLKDHLIKKGYVPEKDAMCYVWRRYYTSDLWLYDPAIQVFKTEPDP